MQIKTKIVSSHTADSKPLKQEVNGTVILPPFSILCPICLPLKEVTGRVGYKVLMEVDNNILLIIGDPLGILVQEHRPQPVHILNIIITILINYTL